MDEKELHEQKLASKFANEIMEKLKQIDPDLVLTLKIEKSQPTQDGLFSDWHDKWNDGNRWWDSFGKAPKNLK